METLEKRPQKGIEERIDDLEQQVNSLREMLANSKDILSMDEAATYLNVNKSYLYKLTSNQQIPHYKPNGGKVYFERVLLDEWLRQNPVKTIAEIDADASRWLINENHRRKK
jgi:excisionase family DNA binding protein